MRLASATAVALMAAVLSGPGALGQGTQGQSRVWVENFDYVVEIDGAVSHQARLFSSSGRPSMLLVTPELKDGVVLQAGANEVLKVSRAAISGVPEAEHLLVPDAEILGPPTPYTRDGDAVIFFVDGHRVKLLRKPPLVGPTTTEELLAKLPAYQRGMQAYLPADSDTIYLKGYKYPVRIEVFFGSWCPHCKQAVPQLLKSLSVASNDNIQVTFVGVPTPPFNDYPPARDKAVKGVPTFIVYAGDQEIGRVSAIPEDSSVEHELVKVLFAYQQSRG